MNKKQRRLPKTPRNSVVLSREEYERLVKTAQGKIGNMKSTDFLKACISSGVMVEAVSTEEQVKQAYEKGCKEIAEKILNAQYQECKIAEQDVLKARGGNKNDDYYKGFSLGMTNTKMHIQELARQFGVEIME